MPDIRGFKIDGTVYQYDYEYLLNKPEAIPQHHQEDSGKVLTVSNTNNQLQWGEIPAEVPSHLVEDEGKVLSVQNNQLQWKEMVPSYSSQNDHGKVLTVSNVGNQLEWEEIPVELPNYTTGSEEGKVLTVHDNNLTWENVPTELPTREPEDEGKVLKIQNNALQWGTVEGGTTLPPYNIEEDGGKVLAVGPTDTESLVWQELEESPIPNFSSDEDAGKVLMVADENDQLEWAQIPSLPPLESGDDDLYTLVANPSAGSIEWSGMAVPFPEDWDMGKTFTTSGWDGAIVPIPDSASGGEVLTYNPNGSLEWAAQTPEIPDDTYARSGDVLTTQGAGLLTWETIIGVPSPENAQSGDLLIFNGVEVGWSPQWWEDLPSTSGASEGDVLTVDDNGHPEWRTPSGGGGGSDLPDYYGQPNYSTLIVKDCDLEWAPGIPSYEDVGDRSMLIVSGCDLAWAPGFPEWDTSGEEYFLCASGTALEWQLCDDLIDLVLPPYAGEHSDGTVLMVVGDTGDAALTWDHIIPNYSQSDAGKVLSVNAQGELEWKTLS